MTRQDVLLLVKSAARDNDRAARSSMDFRADNPRLLTEACRVIVKTAAPKYAKEFAYGYLGGSYNEGYLPE